MICMLYLGIYALLANYGMFAHDAKIGDVGVIMQNRIVSLYQIPYKCHGLIQSLLPLFWL